jgi:hypothetical protein
MSLTIFVLLLILMGGHELQATARAQPSACSSAAGGAAGSWPEHGETDPPHTDSALKLGHGNVRARLCVEDDTDAVLAVIPWRQRRLINAWCALLSTQHTIRCWAS